jgi:hypothetical protein
MYKIQCGPIYTAGYISFETAIKKLNDVCFANVSLQCIRWLHAIVNGPAIHSFEILVPLLRSDVSFRKCLRAEDVRGHVDTQVLNT